jgi:uncharacterized membrane protein YphA (DoxX/SURF4 family)
MIPAPIIALIRVILGGLFTFSGIAKLFDLKGFSVIVAKFNLLPRQLVKPFAYLLPFAETTAGLWLLINRQTFWAALFTAALIATSNIGIANALIKNKKIDNCGCFGPAIKVPVTWKKFIENIFWLSIALILLWSAR